MKLPLLATNVLAVTATVLIPLLPIESAKAEDVCIVINRNQVVCGRPASEHEIRQHRGWNSREYNSNYERQSEDSYREINKIYREVVGRDANYREIQTWLKDLRRGRRLRDIRYEIADSAEAENAINQIYLEVLGRNADRNGLKTFSRQLALGKSLRDIRRSIQNSEEGRGRKR